MPLRPARAVRPQRCEKDLVSVGGSNCMTTSTSGRSRPRAATSVARRIDGEEGRAAELVKFVRVFVRAAGGRWPCRENRLV